MYNHMVKSKLKQYAYLNARLRTRISKVLPDQVFDRMLRSKSLTEAFHHLEDTEFAYLEEVYTKTGDLKMAELELFSREIKLLRDLDKNVRDEIKQVLRALSLQYEIENIKGMLRLWFYFRIKHTGMQSSTGYLYKKTIVYDIDVDGIVNAGSLQDVLNFLEHTPYKNVIAPLVPEHGPLETLFPLDNALDIFFYQQVLACLEGLDDTDRVIAKRLLGIEIDIENLSRIMRFTSYYSLETEELSGILIPGGRSFDRSVLLDALRRDNPWQHIESLVRSKFPDWKALVSLDREQVKNRLLMLESVLQGILEKEVHRLLLGNPFTIGILLSYFFIKRKEIRRLMTLLNVKQYDISYERGMKAI